jgi:DNA-directed RNA polymerase
VQTQAELEKGAYGYGRERAADRIAKIEQQGQAADNPYAQAVYRKFVLPLAGAISGEQEAARGRGRKPGHLSLLAPLHPEATALVVVRAALQHLLGRKFDNARMLIAALGEAAYHEHLLEHFSALEPQLFHQISRGFAQRLSRDERRRLNLVRDAAARCTPPRVLPEWDTADIERLGTWMADALATLGMLTIETRSLGKSHTVLVSAITEETVALIEDIRHDAIESSPYFLPCIEPPKDWVRYDDGGWHTEEMRRLTPYAVKSSAMGREELEQADLSESLAALNAMQGTAWRINRRILETLAALGGKVDLGEVLAQGEHPRPSKPEWLANKMDAEDMTEEQLKEFRSWKKETAQWYSTTRERVIKWGRYRQAMSVARRFEEQDRIYFVYFCDFRDRKYALTSGVSPQGSDLQKALLEFADGSPVRTHEAKRWFRITGANRYGYDKDDLNGRVAWTYEHHDSILACAKDAAVCLWWLEADKPLQFLAWCYEYADMCEQGEAFVSRISVGMDGSCNGLQNFSAVLRDEVGGRATNLVASPKPRDIYNQVAVRVAELLKEAPEDEQGYKARWLAHGMNRKIVKRSVMTLPYGSTRFSCSEFIAADYLSEGYVPEFDPTENLKAASYLSHFVWRAIGDVVVKAREAMDWLQASASEVIAGGASRVMWVTPTGFPVVQVYWEQSARQINTKLCGRQKLLVRSPTSKPDKRRHRNGIAPNFVHSLDASHLTRVAVALRAAGIKDMHMVHDDFGVRPADAERLYHTIREEFLRMYSEADPVADFRSRYPTECGPPPSRGTLDLTEVLNSPFFFS